MKKGYRFNSAIAYANYCADVSNVANFNRFGGMVDAVKGRAKGIRQGVANKARNFDQNMMARGNAINNSKLSIANQRAAGLGEGFEVNQPFTADEAMQAARRDRRTGYGRLARNVGGIGAATAGVGAAGYGGYRALRPKQEEEMV